MSWVYLECRDLFDPDPTHIFDLSDSDLFSSPTWDVELRGSSPNPRLLSLESRLLISEYHKQATGRNTSQYRKRSIGLSHNIISLSLRGSGLNEQDITVFNDIILALCQDLPLRLDLGFIA